MVGVEMGFWEGAASPLPTSWGVNEFSLFWPLEQASPQQNVSTLNDLAPMWVLSRHAGRTGFVLKGGSDPLQMGHLTGLP